MIPTWLQAGERWDEMARACAGTPASLTSAWARFQAWPQGRAVALHVRHSGGRESLLPLVVGRRLAASPSPYGGIISNSPWDEEEARWVLKWARASLGCIRLTNNPFSPQPNLPLSFSPFRRQVPQPCHVLALGRLDALRLGYAPHRRLSSELWNALGIRVELYPCSPKHWLDLFHQALQRGGGAPERGALAQLWREAADDLLLAAARRQGEWVGFALLSFVGRIAQLHGWYAQNHHPDIVTALFETCFEAARLHGAVWWDYGPHAESADLARSFGATPWPRSAVQAGWPG